jgi:hypothetical protein
LHNDSISRFERPNYAIKPTPEVALRSIRATLPARHISALAHSRRHTDACEPYLPNTWGGSCSSDRGFFSFLGFIGAKENKVSEFRQTWIDGLREEVAEYTAAIQELVRIRHLMTNRRKVRKLKSTMSETVKWFELLREPIHRATVNLSKIQLRLNPNHLKTKRGCEEALLMGCIEKSRMGFISGDYSAAFAACPEIREAAAVILKSTWDLVKKGEAGYQRTKNIARGIVVMTSTAVLIAAVGVALKLLFWSTGY